MKKIQNVTEENHQRIIEGFNYGVNLITYENNYSSDLLNRKLQILNAYYDNDVLEEREGFDIEQEDGTFADKIEGVRCVIFRKQNETIPVLHKDNYEGLQHLKSVLFNKGISSNLNIDVKLRKYYRNLALQMNVKFKDNVFDASNRSVGNRKVGTGISTQIKTAFLNGDKNIGFSSYRTNAQTVRNAVSAFGKIIGRKFSVEIHGFEIFVIFIQFTESELKIMQLKTAILMLKKESTKDYITSLFYEFLEIETEDETENETIETFDDFEENEPDDKDF